MSDVTLIVRTREGVREVPVNGERLTIGRTDQATLIINDEGLSRLHASINRRGDQVWVLDEGSTNGTVLNGLEVSAGSGALLFDGDEIAIGNHTTIQVIIDHSVGEESPKEEVAAAEFTETPPPLPPPPPISMAAGTQPPQSSKLPIILAVAATLSLLLVVGAIIGVRAWQEGQSEKTVERSKLKAQQQQQQLTIALPEEIQTTPTPIEEALLPSTTPVAVPTEPAVNQHVIAATTPQPQGTTLQLSSPTPQPVVGSDIVTTTRATSSRTAGGKLYLQMSTPEQMAFVEQKAQHVSSMMGNRPYAFTPEALDWIKRYVDAYARRVGNNSTRLWGEDMRFMFARARGQYVPYIIRAFNGRGVPPVIGVYICVIETEYRNIESENFAGAAGLFQFIGPTAEAYGVPRAERTNIDKMAPAAAAYISDRIAEFGTDSMSVALGIAGYNRNPDSVRRDLRDVLNSENKERSFWTLIINSTKLDRFFQGENIKYVPRFFAAAIVGENPWAFGLEGMQPLSTYDAIPIK